MHSSCHFLLIGRVSSSSLCTSRRRNDIYESDDGKNGDDARGERRRGSRSSNRNHCCWPSNSQSGVDWHRQSGARRLATTAARSGRLAMQRKCDDEKNGDDARGERRRGSRTSNRNQSCWPSDPQPGADWHRQSGARRLATTAAERSNRDAEKVRRRRERRRRGERRSGDDARGGDDV